MSNSTKNKKKKSKSSIGEKHKASHDVHTEIKSQIETEAETEAELETETSEETASSQDSSQSTSDEAPIRVEFPYSDLVRSYVPDAMAIADKALGDWKTEGSFMNLGIENPYANMAVSLSLQNAKKIEKKLEEKGVLPVVRMGFEVLKSKVQKQK